jgi:hypothetical protein
MTGFPDSYRVKIRSMTLIAVILLSLAGVSAAYELSIYAPMSVQRGMPLVVNGTSNLPAGISVDVVLYRSEYVTEEIARETVTLQGPKEFTVVFDTKDLTKGQYKVEVPGIQAYAYLGNSTTIRVIQIIDRTDEMTIKSPRTQEMDGTLELRGIIPALRNTGVQVQVIGPGNEVVFGPEYIATLYDGSFSKEVKIEVPGTYEVSFTDNKGYIGTFPFEVTPRYEPTTVPTTLEPRIAAVTATAHSGNDRPAYFTVTGAQGKVKISTSAGVDWVIEYPDAQGVIQKVNSKGQIDPEEVTIESGGATVYLKVYPYRFSDEGDVTVFAEGAERIGVATEVPPVFAATATPTPKSPLPVFLAMLALLALGMKRALR